MTVMPMDDSRTAAFIRHLVKEEKALRSENRRRQRAFITKRVHSSELDEALRDGWELQRSGKRKSVIKKRKSHHKALEDRVWCLLYRMGYPTLSGDHFRLEFDRQDGSKGKKQIDVFACDAETAFVVECKSRLDRGRRSLQKDLQETVSLKDYVRRAVFSMYGDSAKPKIIWAYATQNIIWSEQDADRANDGDISVITENEIQYYETFLKHMGPAGRYQILGEFLRSKKVPGLGEVRLPAIRGKIGNEKFYSFVVSPRHLLKIAFVNHQALNHPDGRPAYQ